MSIQPKICSLEKLMWKALMALIALIGRKHSSFNLSWFCSDPFYHAWLPLPIPLYLLGLSSSFGVAAQNVASQLTHSTCLCSIILCYPGQCLAPSSKFLNASLSSRYTSSLFKCQVTERKLKLLMEPVKK